MGNNESQNLSSSQLDNSSKVDFIDLKQCYENINPCERELIKEISINLITFLLENFRSLIFLFSHINNPHFLNQGEIKELRQSSKFAIWLSELNRKVYLSRKEILNYRKSFIHLIKIDKEKNKKSSDSGFLEDLVNLIKGDPKSITAFFCDIQINNYYWNIKNSLKEISKILKLKE